MPFVVGENVGPYRIVEKLGRGGMATVFKAYHAALDRYVAIKALHPAFMEDPNFLARFQREARVVARLEHPNIVPIYDFSEHDGRPYLVMKFIDGETLKARLTREGVSPEETLRIIEAVGSALAYAHQEGILHRDIKPSNVLLTPDDRIYLADFGLARIAQAGESTLSGDMMLGTPQYISPEQAMGAADLDEGTDIYSFGVMVYEMVVGQVPFSADTPFSIIHDHIYSPLPLPSKLNPNVPEGVERVLLKALSKERSGRFESVAEFVEAFTRAFRQAETAMAAVQRKVSEDADTVPPAPPQTAPLTAAAASQESAPAPTQEKKPARRRLRWWQIAGLVVGVLFCAFLALAVLSGQQEPVVATLEPDQPVEQADVAPGERPADADMPTESDFEALRSRFESFYENEEWISAARYALDVLLTYPDHPDIIPVARFHEVTLRAAVLPTSFDEIPIPEIAAVDPVLALVAEARYSLYYGRLDRAQELLDQAFRMQPENAEIKLVQIELYMRQRRLLLARRLADELTSAPDTPGWVFGIVKALQTRAVEEDIGAAPSMEEAQRKVDANPDDPWAHLMMVEAMLAVRDYDGVEGEMQRVLEMAGEDPAVYFAAADLLRRYHIDLYAIDFYLAGIQASGGTASDHILEQLSAAVYAAASDPQAKEHFAEVGIQGMMLDVGLARYAIYNDDPAVAEAQINNLMTTYAGAPEVDLVTGEFHALLGDPEKAGALLTALLERPELPDWVRVQATLILDELEP